MTYGSFLLQSALILGAVCVAAWVLLKIVLPRMAPAAQGTPLCRVVARIALEPRRSLYVVEAAGRTLLLAGAESGPITLVTELAPAHPRAHARDATG